MLSDADINAIELGCTCTHCNQQFRKSLGWLDKNDSFPCPLCGAEITGAAQIARRVREHIIDGVAHFQSQAGMAKYEYLKFTK